MTYDERCSLLRFPDAPAPDDDGGAASAGAQLQQLLPSMRAQRAVWEGRNRLGSSRDVCAP